MSENGYVYFIRGGNFIKIGHSKNPWKRIQELQTSNPLKLSVVHAIPGDKKLELELHKRFTHCKSQAQNEWFAACNEILSYIEESKKVTPDYTWEDYAFNFHMITVPKGWIRRD